MITAFLLLVPIFAQDPAAGLEEREFRALEEDFERLQQYSDADAVLEEGAKLLVAIMRFRKRYPDGKKALASLELLHNTHMTLGKRWMHSDDPPKAEASFNGAISATRELIDRVKVLQENAETAEQIDTTEKMRVFAEFLFFSSSYHRILALAEQEGRLTDLNDSVVRMEKEFRAFMINYDTWVWALDASIFMGRALEILARAMGTEDFTTALRVWSRCFSFLAKARNLTTDKEWKSDPYVESMSLRSAYHEIHARQAYADMLKKVGAPYRRELTRALDLGEQIFTVYPRAVDSDDGGRIAEEIARVKKKLSKR
jgi:hypothetical protein